MAAPLVLLIDDDDQLRSLYRFNLEHRGLRVTEAASGEAGLESARSERPSVVVLDLTMPGTDGLAVLAAMKADAGLVDIPVIVLTGHTDEDTEDEIRSAGAVAYIAKPVSTEDFLRVVLRHAGGPDGG